MMKCDVLKTKHMIIFISRHAFSEILYVALLGWSKIYVSEFEPHNFLDFAEGPKICLSNDLGKIQNYLD